VYESFYGLSAKPFQLNPDPTFFFGSKQHTRAMSYLEYGLDKNEGFIVITGEIGAGKTTVLRSLLGKIDPHKVEAVQIVSTQLGAEDTLRMVAAAFGVPAANVSKSEILLAIEAFLLKLHMQGRRALLIVDEAQNLTLESMEELRMLSNYQLDNQALLQSFLVGQPEFRRILESPRMEQLRQRVIAACHISPMDEEETREYVRHRLKHVGWTGKPHLEGDAYEALFDVTGGVPRRINSLCDRMLLAGFLAQKFVLGAKDVRDAAAEIHSETGFPVPAADSTPVPDDRDAGANGHDVLSEFMAATDEVRDGDLRLDEKTADHVNALMSRLQAVDFEERLARLERQNNATLSALKHLVNAIRERRSSSGEHQ
jgi:putative secretion ATPase (PEP-CTERM system associated)